MLILGTLGLDLLLISNQILLSTSLLFCFRQKVLTMGYYQALNFVQIIFAQKYPTSKEVVQEPHKLFLDLPLHPAFFTFFLSL